MKYILFVAALPAELNSIKKEVKKLSLSGIRAQFFLTGVGNYKALYNLKHYIDSQKQKPDFIVNIGLCGKTKVANTDIFQIYRILGAANGRELLCPIYIDFTKKHSILSSERVITSEGDMLGENYVDMESYAIDTIGTEEKIPYILIKKPFDTVSEKSLKIDASLFEDCLSDINYGELLKSVKIFLEKNHNTEEENKEKSLTETLRYFHFTFSEKEIWKKGYAKLISYGGDYKNFLKDNLKLDKKIFLEKLTK